MAPAQLVSAILGFLRKHPLTFCCLLVFTPPVYRLLRFFTPLLVSTALCVLALISGGLSPKKGRDKRVDKLKVGNEAVRLSDNTKQGRMVGSAEKTEDARVIDDQRIYAETWVDNSFLLSSADRLDSDAACNQTPMEDEDLQLIQGANTHEQSACSSQNTAESARSTRDSEPDPDLCECDGAERSSIKKPADEQVTTGHKPGDDQCDQEQQQEVIITGDDASEGRVQARDAKLARAMARELARLEASLSCAKERSPWIDNNMEGQNQEAVPMA